MVAAMPVQASAQLDSNTLTTLAVLLLAEKLGIAPEPMFATAVPMGAEFYDYAPAYAIQQYVPNRPVVEIIDLRRQGLAWPVIAERVRVPANDIVILRNRGYFAPTTLWESSFNNGFRLNNYQVTTLRREGLSWSDIENAALVARETGVPIWQVASDYRTRRSWAPVYATYRVKPSIFVNRVNTWRTSRTRPTSWRVASSHDWEVARRVPGRAMPIIRKPHTVIVPRTTIVRPRTTIVRPRTTIVRNHTVVRPRTTIVRSHTVVRPPHKGATVIKTRNRMTVVTPHHNVTMTKTRTHVTTGNNRHSTTVTHVRTTTTTKGKNGQKKNKGGGG
jgi:hypothetical protein